MNNIVLVTTTLYDPSRENDAVRLTCANKMIKAAKEAGIRLLVIDGGSPEAIVTTFEQLGAEVSRIHERSMGGQKRIAFQKAYDTGMEAIVWLEPEKYTLIPEIENIVSPLLLNNADIVIPRRKTLNSYPTAQQYSEQFANITCTSITGLDVDMFFGPRACRREVSSYFTSYHGLFGDKWESLMIPVFWAYKDKKRVVSIDIDYTHPREQTEFEEGRVEFDMKRLDQLNNILPAVQQFWGEEK